MRLALAISLVAASSASALTPLPPCVWDAEAQELHSDDGANADVTYAFTQEAGDRFASSVIDGREAYNWGAQAMVLQHCPTGQELLILLPEGETARFVEAYEAMVFGPEPYTMREIAEALAPMGAGARITENEFGSCACDWLYGEAS